jgi:hypothetical protein
MPGFLGGSTSGGGGVGGEISFPKELIDPVTKLRVSQPETLIDTDFEYGLQPTKWETVELINNTPSFFSKSGDTTIPNIVSITTNAGTREITVTTGLDHGLAVGIPINVQGTKSITADGSYIINSIPNTTTFTYLCKDNQAETLSIEDLYTSIITGEFFQGSQLRISDSEGIVTNGDPVSILTVKTESAHGFGVNTPFYFLNLNSTVAQEFEAANTAAKSFDSTNSATAQTFDGSNTLSQIQIDWSNSATIGGTPSSIVSVSTADDTITVTHTTETFLGQPLGTPLYYEVATSAGYFSTNPRGVVFLKTTNQLASGTSIFQVSTVPDGPAIDIQAGMTGTFQLANQARTFAGNNINSNTQVDISVIKQSEFAVEAANDGGTQTGGLFDNGNPNCTVASFSGSLVNVTTTAGAGLGYYPGAMVRYSTTGSAASGLTNNTTYFIDSFFNTGTDTYAFTLKPLPTLSAITSISGGTGTQTFSRIGVSIDKNVVHIRNSSYVKGDMIQYSSPENGEFVSDANTNFFFIQEAYDTHNYLLSDVLFQPTDATGGVKTQVVWDGRTWNVHTFTTTGTSSFVVNTVGTDPTVDVLIVAGGGSGAGGLGAGGGAGGVIDTTTDATITRPTITATTYSVVVGAGAVGVVSGESISTNNATNPSGNGGNSSVFGLTALGGGGGGHHREVRGPGLNGGSGGGGGGRSGTSAGGSALQPSSASKGYGNAGGLGREGGNYPGGGGGGAGVAGQSPAVVSTSGGKGGDGVFTMIDGTPRWYGGGGGGGTYNDLNFGGGDGGLGGGGGGGSNAWFGGGAGQGGRNLGGLGAYNRGDGGADAAGGNGGANTGGGGGGAAWNQSLGGSGGSGIVIIRYPTTQKQPVTPAASGGTESTITVGKVTYKVHRFLTPGTSTFTVTEPGNLGPFEYLIVAGGGAGGSYVGGGGGGGGVIEGSTYVNSQSYSVVVGAGGTSVGSLSTTVSARGNNGGNSSAFGQTAIGGGGGGVYPEQPGLSGGSGGGAGGFQTGTGSGAAGTSGQGYSGGNTFGARPRSFTGGAGGGGAGQPGTESYNAANKGGDGGNGRVSAILGTKYYFGGGGGGGNYTDGARPGNGGLGGGGGGSSNTANVAGVGGGSALNTGGNGSPNGDPNNRGGDGGANTGGGGGGNGHFGLSGAGGSGIVVIRYPIAIAE